MDSNNIALLVSKFIKGQCTAEERERVLVWWHEAIENEDFLNQLKEGEKKALQYKMHASIQDTIRQKEKEITEKQKSVQIPLFRKNATVYLAAASVLLLIISTFLFSKLTSPSTTVKTAYGKSLEITLPDQSTVILNGNSSLTYSKNWEDNNPRNVWLEGEAYFHVVHTVNHSAFTVHSGEIKVKVLGTKFNVNNRRGITEVVLSEGKVKLENDNTIYTMKPNEMIRYSKAEHRFELEAVNASEKTSWKESMLIFEDESIHAIAEKLEDNYGLKIIFQNEVLENETFSGSVPTDSTLLFIDKIGKLFPVDIIRKGETYIIR